MSYYFLESSVLSKRYATETGTNWILSLVALSAENRIIIAQITPLEIISTLAHKKREANISERKLRANILSIDRHIKREYVTVQFNAQIEKVARQLLLSHPLRAADAIQLASALVINQQLSLPQSLTFIASDRQLLNAAI